MKNRAKVSKVRSIRPYEGKWVNGDFVIIRPLKRTDLTSPNIKPSFLIILDSGERILLGWTDKDAQHQFYVKEFITKPQPWNSKTDVNEHTLKVIRMRGPKWRKISAAIKKGMKLWFQGHDYWGMGAFGEFTIPLIKQVYPQLIANDLISVQPMSQPTAALFFVNYKYGKL